MILVLLSLFMIVGFALRCAEFCFVKRNLRAKDVTLQVKWLCCKHKDLSSDPQDPGNKPRLITHNPSAGRW